MHVSVAERSEAILDALPANVALIDGKGVITAVNAAWRRFGAANGLHSPGHEVGANYLTVCDQTLGDDAAIAQQVAAGIRAVLAGTAPRFELEYPCHAPSQQRWFALSVVPLASGLSQGAVIMHVDVSERTQAQLDLRRNETMFGQMAATIQDVFFLQDAKDRRLLYVSPAYAKVWGRSREALYLDPAEWLHAVHPQDHALVEAALQAGQATGLLALSFRIVHPDGAIRWIELRGYPVRDDAGELIRIAGFATDATERKNTADELRESDHRLSDMFDNVQLATTMLDVDARIKYCNDYLLRLTGWTMAEVVGRDWFETFMPAELGDMKPMLAALLAGRPEARHVENEIFTRTRERRLLRWNNSVLRSATGEAVGVASIGEDITDRRRDEIALRHLNRVHTVLSEISSMSVRVHEQSGLLNEACRIAVESGGFRMAMITLLDQDTQTMRPVASAGKTAELVALSRTVLASTDADRTIIWQASREKQPVVVNDSNKDPRVYFGNEYAQAGVCSLAALPLLVAGDVVGVLVLYAAEPAFFHGAEMKLLAELTDNIAFAIDHIERGEKLAYITSYDPLTGLANQTLFLSRLQARLRPQRGETRKTCVFVFDVERFRSINEAYGPAVGDALLRQIAERIVRVSDGDATRFARLRADRFAVVASGLDDMVQVGRYLEKRLEDSFSAPFRVGDCDLRVDIKIGVALHPDDGDEADGLLRKAESALGRAKQLGTRYLFFDQKMTEHVAERLAMETRLQQALERDEFVLHYQPKIDLASGEVCGAEALIRWQDPLTGLVPPMKFIPILEDTGLIHRVGRWALRRAIADYLGWCDAGLAVPRIAVNVSPMQMRHADFVADIEQALAVDARAAAGLELEITESLVMEDVKHSVALLGRIRAMGVTIAVDDFGTGYSSLSYLAKLPVDTLKIDRSFIIAMTDSAHGLVLVTTIITLAHSLMLKVVAEGVETQAQKQLLQSLRCDEMQGYLFSKPVPGDIFARDFLRPARPFEHGQREATPGQARSTR